MPKQTIDNIYTHTGHLLTAQEATFINAYIETNNGAEAVRRAGYNCKYEKNEAQRLKKKPYIAAEIQYRLDEIRKRNEEKAIATGEEIMQFWTAVMNGEVTDQFGLDAPLSEKIKASEALAKRTLDIDNKVKQNDNTLTVNLIRSKKKK